MPKTQVYQLRLTLKNIRPPIWRRVILRADATFRELHSVIQIVMGWQDAHLHQFYTGKERGVYCKDPITDLTTLDDWFPYTQKPADECRVQLCDRFQSAGARCEYVYDFGDDWRHEIVLEKVLPIERRVTYPLCIGGKRACPPEDSGGPWGYEAMLKALADPHHEQHLEMTEWLGLESAEEWDSEKFDKDTVNELLRDEIADTMNLTAILTTPSAKRTKLLLDAIDGSNRLQRELVKKAKKQRSATNTAKGVRTKTR